MSSLALVFAVSIGLTPSDLHRLRSVREVAIRPDGSAILFSELDSSGPGQPESKLAILDCATGSVRPFRESGLSGSAPRWSPDGSRVALVGVQDGAFGLVVTDARGGGERLVAKVERTNHPLPSPGDALDWSPDSRSLVFVSAVPGPESEEATGDPVVIRRYLYKPTASEGQTRFNDNRRTHLFLVDATGGEPPRQLTDGPTYEHSVSFSPKGDEILFVSNRDRDPDRFFNYDVFVLAVKDASVRRLTRTENAEYRPQWSPDGSAIVYEGTSRGLTSSETTMEDTHVWIMNADGSGRRELSGLDNRQSEPAWGRDGKWIYFTVEERGTEALYRVRPSGGEAEAVIRERGRVGSFSLSEGGDIAYAFHSADDLPQLYLREASGGSHKLTSPNREVLAATTLAETLPLEFLSFDGKKVEAFLTLPPVKGSARVPLIVVLKGGPHSQSGPELNPRAQ
ncbi:MAG TPA: hypothetical protein VIE88_02665, partial [Vicinamibacteria bacterium]